MRNAPRLFFIVTLLILMVSPVSAQVPLPSKGSHQSQSTQSQRQLDEQLARSFYNNKEYDKSADIYLQLYNNYKSYHYFSQYVECMLFLENYKEAEEALKSFIKKDNTTNKWKSQISLAFVYMKNNETYIMTRLLKI